LRIHKKENNIEQPKKGGSPTWVDNLVNNYLPRCTVALRGGLISLWLYKENNKLRN
jgi:hypothetical protein